MYLDQFMDDGIEIDPDFDIEKETNHHIDRLAFEAAYSRLCHEHKRRLGPDATARELARDKTYAKRNMHGCLSLLQAYGITGITIRNKVDAYLTDTEAKTIAAQVNWQEQLNTKVTDLRNAQRRIATHCLKNGTIKEGNRLVLRLENELNSMVDRYKRVFPTTNNTEELPETDK